MCFSFVVALRFAALDAIVTQSVASLSTIFAVGHAVGAQVVMQWSVRCAKRVGHVVIYCLCFLED
jgi:hypothetical protein